VPIDTEIYCPRPPHDSHKNAVVKSAYRISDALSNPGASSSALRFLDVDATSGAVRTKLTLDRKARCRLDVDLWNDVDGTSSRESSALRLSVVVARSSRSHDDVGSADADYELSVAENSPRGTHVGAVSPADLCLPMSDDADDHVVYRLVVSYSGQYSVCSVFGHAHYSAVLLPLLSCSCVCRALDIDDVRSTILQP